MIQRSSSTRDGLARLELLLGLAFIALILQVVPSLGHALLYAADFRNWPRTAWFAANAIFVAVLMAIRLGPDLLLELRERRQRISEERSKAAKALKLKEERETVERMQESKRRRIY